MLLKTLCQKKSINSALINPKVSFLAVIFVFPVKSGMPSDDELEELGSEIHSPSISSWKKLARRLKIEESKINAIDNEENELTEKAYKMLLQWRRSKGCEATYKALFLALNHNLVDRTDLAKKYCCES